ncbi:ABC transporter permease [Paenibacillus sp. 32O-W]|uniref:ABC transporter permease n=1 Tax=Paenibacillus sp. 32O-W TaxID=1695218 RepID=UPI0011A3E3F0|nr:ABC transporter permease [Paenibacillus sp. 32O-W]
MSFWKNRQLILQLTKREIAGRYRGSYLGIVWSFLTPLFMLFIYTFVFSVVFQAKWNTGTGSKLEFAFIIFSGIIAFNVFSEVLSSAPSLITSNSNYVKKIVFPLEILVIVKLCSSLFHAFINTLILFFGLFLFMNIVNWTVLFLPVVLLPLSLITLGIGWFLASLGTYFRDIGHFIGIIISALMFLSPIFYPVSNIPEDFQAIYYFNPLSYVVEDMRQILVFGQTPDWNWIIWGSLIGVGISALGFLWFNKTRGGFADVL